MVVFGNFVLVHSAYSNTRIAAINQYNKVLWYYPKIIQSRDTVTCCYSVSIQTQQITCIYEFSWYIVVHNIAIGIPMS